MQGKMGTLLVSATSFVTSDWYGKGEHLKIQLCKIHKMAQGQRFTLLYASY